MRVLLTGATGFFGSHLTRALIARGHEAAIIKRHGSRLDRIAGLVPDHLCHDIENSPAEFILKFRPDALIHLATCYGRRGEGVHELFRTNVCLPMRLMEAADGAGVPLFVNADTSLPAEISPYAMSKSHFAHWCKLAVNSGAIRVMNIRMESVYGPDDDDTKFVTQLVRSLVRNDPDFPMTAGNQCRDFIFVEDAALAFALLLENASQQAGSPWIEAEVGTGTMTSIRQFAETAHRLAKSETRLNFGAKPPRPGELMQTRADIRKLEALGWGGGRGLEAGLGATIAAERQRI